MQRYARVGLAQHREKGDNQSLNDLSRDKVKTTKNGQYKYREK